MKVSVKTRPNKDGKTARIYLDVSQNGKRSRRVLDLWVWVRGSKRLTPEQVAHNNQALTDADIQRNQIENELLNGADLKRKTKAATLRDLVAVYVTDKERADNTAATYKQMLRYVNGNVNTATLDADQMNELYKQLRKADGISNNTQLLYRAKLDAVIRYGIKKGYCNAGILDQTDDKPKADHHEREFLTASELQLLVDDYNKTGKNWQRVFLFSCFTGLRYSDVKALTWGDVEINRIINGDGFYSEFNIKLTTQKTNTFVRVPLNDQARQLLAPKHEYDTDKDPVFVVPDNSSLRKVLLTWCKAHGINKNVSFHTARHTFATLALNSGAELYTVSKLLGHHSITTTQIYADVIDTTKQQAVKALNDLIK